MVLTANYEVGKLAPCGGVYAGRFAIGEGTECDVFALQQTLGDCYFEYGVRAIAGLKVAGRTGFRPENNENYFSELKKYLRAHVSDNSGKNDPYSHLFLPWTQPLWTIVSDKLTKREKSDFVLPQVKDDNSGFEHHLWSCQSDGPWDNKTGDGSYTNRKEYVDSRRGTRGWAYITSSANAFNFLERRSGLIAFAAAPAPQ